MLLSEIKPNTNRAADPVYAESLWISEMLKFDSWWQINWTEISQQLGFNTDCILFLMSLVIPEDSLRSKIKLCLLSHFHSPVQSLHDEYCHVSFCKLQKFLDTPLYSE